MSPQRTSDPDVALGWARDVLGPASPVAFLLARSRFSHAELDGDSLSITLGGEGNFGAGFGAHPPIDPSWTRCMLSGSDPGERVGELVRADRWDFFTRPTAASDDAAAVAVLDDDDAVTSFLRDNAPTSAVWPGNREIVHWYATSDDAGVVSLAAVVRWESGYHVISSVATRVDARGRGHARTLMRGIVARLHDEGVDWVGLGVAHDNLAAQRVYRATGFSRRAEFVVYAPAGSRRHH